MASNLWYANRAWVMLRAGHNTSSAARPCSVLYGATSVTIIVGSASVGGVQKAHLPAELIRVVQRST